MNNIVSVSIDRTNNSSGAMVYRLTIEHLDESFSSIITEYDFDNIYSSFEFLSTLENIS